MARIPYAEKGQEAQGATHVYQQLEQGMGLVPNVVKLLGHSGPASQGIGTLLDIYFGQLSITDRVREIAYLTVARLNGCDYCQGHHVPAARQAGLLDMQIEDLGEDGFDSGEFSEPERAVIRFAYETTRDVKASDEAVEELKTHFSDAAIAEITFVVASGNFIQRVGKNLGVELES
ncbi:carboxymuconolactone decarboxylase family protein [uncultured Halovibrio sp.]|uniref:carboxymuconolactone decarboxylase family protein n=1 Tax=uncultured Halovibrio sp. TaxID=985049 RepID=UPI0025E27B6A|nr:carboxymuconolactone decarboxylase family protein [uncultured Halovibrio sp.]